MPEHLPACIRSDGDEPRETHLLQKPADKIIRSGELEPCGLKTCGKNHSRATGLRLNKGLNLYDVLQDMRLEVVQFVL